jgi:hypothetical protein
MISMRVDGEMVSADLAICGDRRRIDMGVLLLEHGDCSGFLTKSMP